MAKKRELKKHTSAIHTSGKLSLLERKLSNVLLYNAYDELLSKQIHEIDIHALAEVSGFNSKDIETLKNSLRSLQSVSVEWDILNEGGEQEWGTSSLLSSVKVTGSNCTYEYSKALSEKLSEPKHFGIINIEIQKNFTSGYALTIYEICSRFKGLLSKREHCYTHWYKLEDFKKFLGVQKSEYYKEFKQLNAKIIKPSVNEINGSLKKYAGTDIHITAEYKRTSRAVSDIRFVIEKSIQAPLPFERSELDDLRKSHHYLKLLEFGFNDKGAIHIIQTNDQAYVKEKIDVTEQAIKSHSIKSSIAGYLNTAIKQDFKPAVNPTTKNAESKKAEEKIKRYEKNLAEESQALRKKHSIAIRAEYIESLSVKQQAELLADLRDSKTPVIKKLIKTLQSPQIASEINELIPDFESKLQELMKNETV